MFSAFLLKEWGTNMAKRLGGTKKSSESVYGGADIIPGSPLGLAKGAVKYKKLAPGRN